jgi:hypothetical protein
MVLSALLLEVGIFWPQRHVRFWHFADLCGEFQDVSF